MKLLFRLLTLLFFTLATLSANAQEPILTADAAILIDARTGQVLYEKNADKREYPASMTKMMTCILALERGNPLKTIAVSANAANVESTELCGGEWIRLGDLTYQMMLISDNGAATAIAEAIGGNVNHFASMMNEKARAIGAVGTHFVNANGMPDEDHYSTARDMAKIAQYGLRNKEFQQIVSTKSKQVHYERPSKNLPCTNTNHLLFTYDGAIGVKTGYTRAAQGCLAAAATRNGRTLIAVIMHAGWDSRFTEAAALLNHGFEMKKGLVTGDLNTTFEHRSIYTSRRFHSIMRRTNPVEPIEPVEPSEPLPAPLQKFPIFIRINERNIKLPFTIQRRTLMKKLILTSLLTLALAASASAAVPAGGVYLDKDGTPLTEAQQVPPSLRSHKMAPQNAAIQEAMAALPHSTSTLIALTVTEDGTAANASVAQSSGSIILDQYAIDSVNLWQFHPAKRGDRSVSTSVTIPLRFISTMISVPAAPTSQVLKDMPEEVREAAERNAHPILTVKVYVNSDGKMDGAPEVMKDEKLSGADFKALSKYVTASVKTWTFTAAKNPDGEAIGSEVLIPVQL